MREALSYHPPLEPQMLEALVPGLLDGRGEPVVLLLPTFHSTLSAPHPQMFLFFYLCGPSNHSCDTWPGTEPSGLWPFHIGRAKWMGQSDLSEERDADREGWSPTWACKALTAPLRAGHLPPGTLPCLPSASPPRKGQQSFLPSSRKHIYPGQSSSRPHVALISRGARRPEASTHRVSHIFFLFPLGGSGWARLAISDWGQEGEHPPSPSRLSITAGLSPPGHRRAG